MKAGDPSNMYIHLGGDKIIRSSELIAILDVAGDKPSNQDKMFFTHAEQEKAVEKIGDEDAKSLVVTEMKLYYSPISSSTLKKRAKHFSN